MLASCRTAFAAHWLGEEIERLEEGGGRDYRAYLLVGYYKWPVDIQYVSRARIEGFGVCE